MRRSEASMASSPASRTTSMSPQVGRSRSGTIPRVRAQLAHDHVLVLVGRRLLARRGRLLLLHLAGGGVAARGGHHQLDEQIRRTPRERGEYLFGEALRGRWHRGALLCVRLADGEHRGIRAGSLEERLARRVVLGARQVTARRGRRRCRRRRCRTRRRSRRRRGRRGDAAVAGDEERGEQQGAQAAHAQRAYSRRRAPVGSRRPAPRAAHRWSARRAGRPRARPASRARSTCPGSRHHRGQGHRATTSSTIAEACG